MELDIDTSLVELYCLIDDVYCESIAPLLPPRIGRPLALSDPEVLTLAILGRWCAVRSERGLWRLARARWLAAFPNLGSESMLNRRIRDVWALLATGLAERLGASTHQVVDGTAIAIARRCRATAAAPFNGIANVGRGGSDHDWILGVRLLVAADAHGAVTGFVVGSATTAERSLAEALLRWRVNPTAPAPSAADLDLIVGPSHHAGGRADPGPILRCQTVGAPWAGPVLADSGFAGAAWHDHWADRYAVDMLTPADPAFRQQPREMRRWFQAARQRIETIIGCLQDRFGITRLRVRTAWGLVTQLAAAMAAHNLCVYLNARAHRPLLAELFLV